jgi:hypothetical protein
VFFLDNSRPSRQALGQAKMPTDILYENKGITRFGKQSAVAVKSYWPLVNLHYLLGVLQYYFRVFVVCGDMPRKSGDNEH